jgi:hypothetical protein
MKSKRRTISFRKEGPNLSASVNGRFPAYTVVRVRRSTAKRHDPLILNLVECMCTKYVVFGVVPRHSSTIQVKVKIDN